MGYKFSDSDLEFEQLIKRQNQQEAERLETARKIEEVEHKEEDKHSENTRTIAKEAPKAVTAQQFSERLSLIRPGMTPQQTEQILGQKLKLEKYDERSLQAIFPEGVMLFFSEDIIYSIHYLKPYSLPVDGIRIGDSPDFVRSHKGSPATMDGTFGSWFYAGTDNSYSVRYDFAFCPECTDIFLFANHNATSQPVQRSDVSADLSAKEQIISVFKKILELFGKALSVLFRFLGNVLSAFFRWYGRAWKHPNFWSRFGLICLALWFTSFSAIFAGTTCQSIEKCTTSRSCVDNVSSNRQSAIDIEDLYATGAQKEEESQKFSDLKIESRSNFELSKLESDTNGFTYEGDNNCVITLYSLTQAEGSVVFDTTEDDYRYISGILSHGGESYRTIQLTFFAYYGEVIGWKQLGNVIEITPLFDPDVLCLSLELGCEKIKITAKKIDAGIFDFYSSIILSDFRLYKENPEGKIEAPKYLDETDVNKETADALDKVGKSGRDINKLTVVYSSSNVSFTNEFTDKYSNRFLGDNISVIKLSGYSMGENVGKLVLATDSRKYKYLGGIISCGSDAGSATLEFYAYCNGALKQLGDTIQISDLHCPAKVCLPIDPGCTKIYIKAHNPSAGYSGPEINLMLYHLRLYKEEPSEIIENEMIN